MKPPIFIALIHLRIGLLITLLALLPQMVIPCRAVLAFYVSPSGNDTNAGTIGAPFQTLAAAQAAVRGVNATATNDITVYLAGGLYRMTNSLFLSSIDSGMNGYRVIYQAQAGQTPVLDGAILVTNWTLHDAGKNIWQAAVPSRTQFRQFYVNGNKAHLASSANALGLVATTNGLSTSNPFFLSLSNSPSLVNLEVVTRPNGWIQDILPVATISPGGTVTIQQPCWSNAQMATFPANDNPVWVQNAYELLTNAGDWYLRTASNIVYYIPRSTDNMTNAIVEAPVLQQLILLAGTSNNPVSNLRFQGISFEMTTWLLPAPGYGLPQTQANQPVDTSSNWSVTAALDGSWTRSVDVSQCLFSDLGGDGVNLLKGSKYCAIDHCLFYDLSASAVQLGLGWEPDGAVAATSPEIVEGIVVANNTVHDDNQDYPSGCGIYAGYTRNCTLIHNLLYNLPYTGISLGWGWGVSNSVFTSGNFINGNLVHDHMQLLGDGGAAYVNGIQYHATMSDNYSYNQKNVFGVLYLDDGSENWSVFENVALKANAEEWLSMKGVDNHAYSNYNDNAYARIANYVNCSWSGNTTITNGNWPPDAQSIMQGAGPWSGVYYSSRPGSVLIGPTNGNGGFTQGLTNWTVGGPLNSQAGVGAGFFPDANTPTSNNCAYFSASNAPAGATLSTSFAAVAGHVYALAYSQSTEENLSNQSLTISVLQPTNTLTLGTSTTWVTNLYQRFVYTFTATQTGTDTLRFTDTTTASNYLSSACALDNVELRDVAPPTLSFQIQPASQTIDRGATATFSAQAAGGSGNYTYQWQQNGSNLSGQTNSTLMLSSVTTNMSGYTYDVVASNGTTNITSTNAVLTIPSLSFEMQPVNQFAVSGSSVTFAAQVTGGSGSYTYQWQQNGINLPGQTSSSLVLTSVTTNMNGYNYDVVVNDGYTGITSTTALLRLGLVSGLVDVQFKAANAAATSMSGAAAIGSPGDTWNQPATAAGQTPATTALNLVNSSSSGLTLTCLYVYGQGGSAPAMSNAPALFTSSVFMEPGNVGTLTISGFNNNQFVADLYIYSAAFEDTNGGTIADGDQGGVFTVGSTTLGTDDNGTIIPYTLGTNYVHFTNLIAGGDGNLVITWTTFLGDGTECEGLQIALATPLAPASFVQQPASETAAAGASATFSVQTTNGSGRYIYQWQQNGSNLSGQTNSTLVLSSVTSGMNGDTYDVVVNDGITEITSTNATLTVVESMQLLNIDVTDWNTSSPVYDGPGALGGISDTNWNGLTVLGDGSGNPVTINLSDITNSLGSATSFNFSLTAVNPGGGHNSASLTNGCNPVGLLGHYGYTYGGAGAFIGTFTNLNAYNGEPFTVVYYAGNSSEIGICDGVTLTNIETVRDITAGNGVAYQTFTGFVTNGQVQFTVTNYDGDTYSTLSGAQLQIIVSNLLSFATQPANQIAAIGSSAAFSTQATNGSGYYTYQWQQNGSNLSSQTNSTLTLTGVTTNMNGYIYDVIVSDGITNITSTSVTLTVVESVQLLNIDVYDWNTSSPVYNGQGALGGPADTNWNGLTVPLDTSGNPGTISLVNLTNSIGNPTPYGFNLTAVNPGGGHNSTSLAYGCNPVGLLGHYGYTYGGQGAFIGVFTNLAAYNGQPFTVLYYAGNDWEIGICDGVTKTNQEYVRDINAGDGVAYETFTGIVTNGQVQLIVTNPPGDYYCTLPGMQLQVIVPALLSFLHQPATQIAAVGGTAIFSVQPTNGTGHYTYQWQQNGSNLSSQTNSTLTLTAVTTNMNGDTYDVIVSDGITNITSTNAPLIVVESVQLLNIDLTDWNTSSPVFNGQGALGGPADTNWNGLTILGDGSGNPVTINLNDITNSLGSATSFNFNLTAVNPGGGHNSASLTNGCNPVGLLGHYGYTYGGEGAFIGTFTNLSTYNGEPFTVVYYAGNCSEIGICYGVTLTNIETVRDINAGNGVAYQAFTGFVTNGQVQFTVTNCEGDSYSTLSGAQLQIIVPLPSGSMHLETAPTKAPPLSVSWVAGQMVLQWPTALSSQGYKLYSSPVLGPGAAWTEVTAAAPATDPDNTALMQMVLRPATTMFYRLMIQ
jgi:hypothetical protein